MKIIFTLLAIFPFTLATHAQTSVYHLFSDSNAVWNFHSSVYCIMGNGDAYYSITISGDTLINSKTYHKLSTPYVQSIVSGTCYSASSGGGAIRQDTTNRKVFFIQPSDSVEQLLYDFNMQVGDTVKGFIESWAFIKDTVQSVDSVLVGSSYRKRWNLPCYNIHFIEGIGSTYGLIARSPGCITDQADYSITCFKQNGISLYPDTVTSCDIISSVNNHSVTKASITVSPNPTTNLLTITTTSTQPSQIILYDICLRQTMEEKFTGSTTLNIANLAKGVYLYRVTNENGEVMQGKVVKE